MTKENNNRRTIVRDAYGEIAQSGGSCCGGSSCCGSSQPRDIAEAIGYSSEELNDLPEASNMGLSCGNPNAIASLRAGENVLDLGCGGGFDVFIAAGKVGSTGHCIGVDMTPDMIDRARINAESFRDRTGLTNVQFRLGEIEHLPVPDATVDVVISNCVINLSDEKEQVWEEIARVLKSGGRACISDLALIQQLPEQLRQSVEALVGCVAGAALIDETKRMIDSAGLFIESIREHNEYLDFMTETQDPLYRQIIEMLPEKTHISDYISSISIVARKKT